MTLADEDIVFRLNVEIPLTAADGGTLALTVDHLEVVDGLVGLQGQVPAAEVARLFERGDFHLDGEVPPHGLEPDQPVTVRLRLAPQLADTFADGDEMFAAFAEDVAPMRDTGSWYALEVVQHLPVPGQDDGWIELGTRTRWADRA